MKKFFTLDNVLLLALGVFLGGGFLMFLEYERHLRL